MGKSWLVGSLAIAVARGTEWLGFVCEKGRVLVVDNELHPETTASRFRKLFGGLGVVPQEADAHVVLRKHKEKDRAVFDAVVRSWPCIERFVLRFDFPIWVRDDGVDLNAIEGENRLDSDEDVFRLSKS